MLSMARLVGTHSDGGRTKLRVWRCAAALTQDGFIAVSEMGPPAPVRTGPSGGVIIPAALPLDQGWNVLPSGLYLRELYRLDLDSDHDVTGFVAEYGAMAGVDWSTLIPPTWLGFSHDGRHRPSSSIIQKGAERAWPLLEVVRLRTESRVEHDDSILLHPEEFRLRAKLLRDAARTWLAASGQLRPQAAIEAWESEIGPRPRGLDEAVWDFLVPLLNVGLVPFHPRLAHMTEQPDPLAYDLFHALCLQLASDIESRREWIACAKCGALFSRSIRAEEDYDRRQHSKKVQDVMRQRAANIKYCSAKCANAASTAAYRARKRSEAKQPS